MKTKIFLSLFFISVFASAQINWNLITTGMPLTYAPKDLALAPNGDIYMLCQRQQNTVYTAKLLKSTNYGNLWSEITMTGLPQIQPTHLIFSGTKLILMGYVFTTPNYVMYSSSDNGSSWTLVNTGLPNTYEFVGLTKDVNENLYVCGSKPGVSNDVPMLIKSTDNGSTWTEISMNNMSIWNGAGAMQASGNKLFMSVFAFNPSMSDVLKSNNGGLSWVSSSSGLANTFPADFAVKDTSEVFILGNSGGGMVLFSTTDGGNFWNTIPTSGHSNLMTSAVSILQTNGNGPMLMAGVGSSTVTFYVYSSQLGAGLNENGSDAEQIQVFPNPAFNELSIRVNNLGIDEIQSVEIVSVSGQLVKKVDNNIENINIRTLKPGLYQLKIITANSVLVKRFIKSD